MEIAVLAFGSLVWQPRNAHGALAVRAGARWKANGPRLPVEFARISSDGRLTLVVLAGYPVESQVMWIPSGHEELAEARANLAERETGAPLGAVHAVTSAGDVAGSPEPSIVAAVTAWMSRIPRLDAAIWAGLPPGSRWSEHGFDGFTPTAAVDYFGSLRGRTRRRATEYVQNAPPQIDTPVRRALMEMIGG